MTQHNHRISPDGLSVAYHTNEMGPYQVWVASFPTLENRRQVSADGGTHPRWRADGEELFFLDDDGHVMAVAVEPGPIPEFGVPAPLFRGPAPPAFFASQFSVTGDGQRFLLAVGPGYAADRAPLRVVVNWTRALNGPAR